MNDAIYTALRADVSKYLDELDNTGAYSRSHVTLHRLYQAYGAENVDRETERQFEMRRKLFNKP